jgi:hypothetical protein
MLSVIILTKDSEIYIEKCLNSLFLDIRKSGEETKVNVIDNGSKDKTLVILDRLKKKFPNLNVIKLGKNFGTTVSRNIGIRQDNSDNVLILDSDTEVQPGTIKTLIEVIKRNNEIGIAAPRLFYTDGSVQFSSKKFPTLKVKICKLLPFQWAKNRAESDELYESAVYSKDFDQIIEVDYCISAAWMVNRRAIEDVGLLDEKIFYSPEDVDYCVRMWLKAWKVMYIPSASVIHHTQRESYKKLRAALNHIKGLFYFFNKYGYWFNRKKLYSKIQRVNSKTKN